MSPDIHFQSPHLKPQKGGCVLFLILCLSLSVVIRIESVIVIHYSSALVSGSFQPLPLLFLPLKSC